MSIDFSSTIINTPTHHVYGQAELDQAFTNMRNGGFFSLYHYVREFIEFGLTEGLGAPEQPGYDLYTPSPSGNAFASQRYRTNASSSSSLGPGYNMNGDSMYSHPSYADNVPSFVGANRNNFDMMTIPSYASGKMEPLTPNSPVGPLPSASTFPPSVAMNGVHKEYPHPVYQDVMPDHRMAPMTTNGYQHSEYTEEYPINSGLPFSPSTMHFQERMGRYQPDDRFPQSAGPPAPVPSHLHPSHGHDLLRGVAPHATHNYHRGDNNMQGYEEMPHYMGQSHPEMPMRMSTVDENLARMKLHSHSIIGPSNVLQTFIRFIQAPPLHQNFV
jgi:recombining binding protein suppressor of hairless